MNQTDILIIGVIYNTYIETLRYLESVVPMDSGKLNLILVDNSDKEKPADFLGKIRSYPFVHYFETGKNLGYFGGAREGLQNYLRDNPTYPGWILVTNVDIVFSPQFFDQLNKIDNTENLGVVAPSIISKKWNIDYNPEIIVRYSKRRLQFYLFLYSFFLIHNLFLIGAYFKKRIIGLRTGKKHLSGLSLQGGGKIFAPHGSCLVFHSNYFRRGGTLDLPNFLFGEEILIGETALQLGLDIVYYPGMVIFDYEHASTGFFVNPVMNRYYRQAIRSILDRYYR